MCNLCPTKPTIQQLYTLDSRLRAALTGTSPHLQTAFIQAYLDDAVIPVEEKVTTLTRATLVLGVTAISAPHTLKQTLQHILTGLQPETPELLRIALQYRYDTNCSNDWTAYRLNRAIDEPLLDSAVRLIASTPDIAEGFLLLLTLPWLTSTHRAIIVQQSFKTATNLLPLDGNLLLKAYFAASNSTNTIH